MSVFKIPLQNIPQSFNISLQNVDYTITCKFNDSPDGGWVLDIADGNSGQSLATNIPLITGADCLSGLEYLQIGGQLYVFTDGNETAVPTYLNLGVESNLYFQTVVT